MSKQIDRKIAAALGHYVYALVDPRQNQIFYVGKAKGNARPEQHLVLDKKEHAKNKRIKEINDEGYEVRIDILRHGLDSERTALEVEASIIDALGFENLTNLVRGHNVERGRLALSEVERRYGSNPIDLSSLAGQKHVLFFIERTYSPTMSSGALYDATRQFWYNFPVEKRQGNMDGYDTALAIFDSTVVAVYKIGSWHPAGSTRSSRNLVGVSNVSKRWEFQGSQVNSHHLQGVRLMLNGARLKARQAGYLFIP